MAHVLGEIGEVAGEAVSHGLRVKANKLTVLSEETGMHTFIPLIFIDTYLILSTNKKDAVFSLKKLMV